MFEQVLWTSVSTIKYALNVNPNFLRAPLGVLRVYVTNRHIDNSRMHLLLSLIYNFSISIEN